LIINLRFLIFFVICYIAAANYEYLKNNWQKLLLVPAVIVVVFGLLQQFVLPNNFLEHFGYGPDTIPAVQTIDSDLSNQRIQSTLRGANPLGAYLLLVVTAMFALFSKPNYFRSLGLAAALLALFYSYSRSAWIGVILSVGLLVWWAYGQKNKVKWAAIAAACLVVVISGIILLLRTSEEAQDALLHTSNKTPGSAISSNEARATAIKYAAEDVAKNPMGQGPGTAGPASVRNDRQPKIAENYFLQIGQETGITGMALFITINIFVGMELWRRKTKILPRILLASLIGLTAVNMLSHAWTDDTISYLWWGLAGIALAPAILESKNKRNGKKTEQA
jgi:O-antigen ligase